MDLDYSITIHPPLEGEWTVLRPPGHHPYARDFVQQVAQKTHAAGRFAFYLGKIPSNSFFCWDKQVFSPIDGVVIQAGNGWPDNEFTNIWQTIALWYNATFRFRPKEVEGKLDIRPNAGNYVMIQAHEGFIVLLAHLRNGSLSVNEGEQVRRGDLVGLLGNSGNSTMPHLHMNLFDQMEDPFIAKVLPFVFSEYGTSDNNGHWIESKAMVPEAGDTVRFPSISSALTEVMEKV